MSNETSRKIRSLTPKDSQVLTARMIGAASLSSLNKGELRCIKGLVLSIPRLQRCYGSKVLLSIVKRVVLFLIRPSSAVLPQTQEISGDGQPRHTFPKPFFPRCCGTEAGQDPCLSSVAIFCFLCLSRCQRAFQRENLRREMRRGVAMARWQRTQQILARKERKMAAPNERPRQSTACVTLSIFQKAPNPPQKREESSQMQCAAVRKRKRRAPRERREKGKGLFGSHFQHVQIFAARGCHRCRKKPFL